MSKEIKYNIDYREEYLFIIKVLESYDDNEEWRTILVNHKFNFKKSMLEVIEILKWKIDNAKNYSELNIFIYKNVLDLSEEVYRNL